MFKKPFNYFANKGTKCDYPAKVKIFEWKFEAPSEALLKSLSPKELKFVKPVQICEIAERNFQDEINKEICLTPEKIYKSGIQITPNELNYQQEDLSKLNAQDARDVAKTAAKEAARQQAQKLTDDEIKKAIEQYKAKNEKGENK